jgi:hypothetical protein
LSATQKYECFHDFGLPYCAATSHDDESLTTAGGGGNGAPKEQGHDARAGPSVREGNHRTTRTDCTHSGGEPRLALSTKSTGTRQVK